MVPIRLTAVLMVELLINLPEKSLFRMVAVPAEFVAPGVALVAAVSCTKKFSLISEV